MKKYRFLTHGEIHQTDDEVLWPMGWQKIHPATIGQKVYQYEAENKKIRRPIPFEGKTAFLVNYSPIIRVVVDTTGLDEGEIDWAVQIAAEKEFRQTFNERMMEFGENIDWDNTCEDTDAPYDPHTDLFPDGYIPDGCCPENEFGKKYYWDVFQVGNGGEIKLQVQRIDEPADHDTLASDEVAYELARLAGVDVDENGYVK